MYIAQNSITKVRVYIWLEGQDIDSLETDSQGANLDVSIDFIKDTAATPDEKAEIEADPTDVARKINASLEKRKADVVIDSLRVLLSTTQSISLQKNEEVKALQTKYDEQALQVKQQEEKVEALKKQLQTLQTKLGNYQQQQQQILSEVQKIEQRIKKSSDVVLQNARIGMTYAELISVCGKPRSIKYKYLNYGKIWIEMSGSGSDLYNSIVLKGAYVTDPSELYGSRNIIKE